MARPQKIRHVCCLPRTAGFEPLGSAAQESVILLVDEYEAIRLIDLERLTQDEAAQQMQVARTTVQGIYDRARYKLADALVHGKRLSIAGGGYRLCDRYGPECASGCHGRCHRRCSQESGEETARQNQNHREVSDMKVAVAYENGQVFQHFGHTEQFKLYNIADGAITSSELVGTQGSGHGALAQFLSDRGVSVLICGGIGAGAKNALAQAGIQLYPGITGDADRAVEAYLGGTLPMRTDVQCSHHNGEHHGSCHSGEDHGGCHSGGCSGHHGQ